ncbi:hypothetical protein SAMN04487818_112217 [Actinokineospora terrae]|uniref:Uncharacterized protein n=2 Tax=Actinokineospora terrae TaxID=155974 RepID=A0A1H9X343_9PSEU|nr:hypothetical protein SAMN04487818_112217 [Actinokineospora terrae]
MSTKSGIGCTGDMLEPVESPPSDGTTFADRPLWTSRDTAAGVAAIALLVTAVCLSTVVRPSPPLHDVALFAHLGFLVLGFGAVLVADYFFVLWVLGRATFAEAVAHTARLHPLIWSGLLGLVASGTLLRPDLSSGATALKLVLVTTLTLNGIQATALGRRMSTLDGPPPVPLLLWGAATSALSQLCWWGAVVIGYLNTTR